MSGTAEGKCIPESVVHQLQYIYKPIFRILNYWLANYCCCQIKILYLQKSTFQDLFKLHHEL